MCPGAGRQAAGLDVTDGPAVSFACPTKAVRPLAHALKSRSTAGWSSLVARRAHNPKVAGSNPAPAIEADQGVGLAKALQTGRPRPRRPPQGGLRRRACGRRFGPVSNECQTGRGGVPRRCWRSVRCAWEATADLELFSAAGSRWGSRDPPPSVRKRGLNVAKASTGTSGVPTRPMCLRRNSSWS